MASFRPGDAIGTRPSDNDIDGSAFDPAESIEYPRGTKAKEKKKAGEVFELNPYLGQAQMDSVLRYVRLQFAFDAIHAQMPTVLDDDQPNIRLAELAKIQNALITAERNLGIAYTARVEKVAKADRKPKPKPQKGKPALRIA